MPVCIHIDCETRASFGKKGSRLAEYCVKHKMIDYVDVVSKKCIHPGCDKHSIFGKKGSRLREYCVEHKPVDYVNVKHKRCLHSGCYVISNFGKKGSKVGEYCKDHKPPDYVDVNHKKCIHPGCDKNPSFGKKESRVAEYCSDHKIIDYVDVNHKKCIHPGCDVRPSFGKKGSKVGEYCKDHKPLDYVDVKNKTCIHPGCETIPGFGKKESRLMEYCSDHKPLDCVNLTDKKCIHPGCDVRPSFGKKGSRLREYCSSHKPVDYVNVKSKRCLHSGCDKHPSFGKKESRVAEYCSDHKPLDHVDVKSKKCIHSQCSTKATYGLLFQPKINCGKHRTPNMYTKNSPKCETQKCKNTPNYTDKNDSYPLRCEEHKYEDDIQISESNCIICDEVLFIKTDSKMCNICAKVDTTVVRHEKELKVKTLLEEENITFIHDKMSDSGCHKHRPDFLIDCSTHYIVVEVDENQHSSYPEQCEIARMVNIQQGFGGMKVLFIRFNPDGYVDNLKNKVRAGITLSRKKRLVSLIKSSMIHPPPHPLSVIKMYYDGDDENNITKEIDVDKLFDKIKNKIDEIVNECDQSSEDDNEILFESDDEDIIEI